MATRISSLTTHLSGGSFVSPSLVSLRALSSMSDASREMTGNASDRSIGEASITFPLHDLLPRRPTGADEVEGHGRNTVIAVLDTGVDPLAPGLRETSDGKIKVVDVVDCSGAWVENSAGGFMGDKADAFIYPFIRSYWELTAQFNRLFVYPIFIYPMGVQWRRHSNRPADLIRRLRDLANNRAQPQTPRAPESIRELLHGK